MSSPPPMPCTARPRTSCTIVVAVPATSRPATNRIMPPNRPGRGPRASLSWPAATMPTTFATRNAVNAQPNAPSPCSSRAAVGSAGVTAIASKAIIEIRTSRPIVVLRSRPREDRRLGDDGEQALR